MRRHGSLENDEELNAAAWEAARGAGVGAARWGLYSGIAAGAAHLYSPIYRGLTIQFKVFVQMSAMVIGSMVEADRRLLAYERAVRHNKRIRRDTEAWRRFENDFEAQGTPGVGSEGAVKREGS
ncbi:hypothetical protein M501DRAFT_928567 [Patellaria atrata CBS 101060]|uniref:Imidazoleglycerol-phosphate dehydratase n=1 Tax=Patellaria atrata CBS 101060 TaxID=1346257 RepID=A0A9P4VRZ7_9PEZI|nr:hypothetical protein M501DRAFT_928567 [Patellaria atrata CBS 101060]